MKSMLDAIRDFSKARQAMKAFQGRIPDIIGHEAINDIHKNFDNESYDNGLSVTLWPARSAKTNEQYDKRYGVKGSVFNSANPLLKQTGNLKDSIEYMVRNGGVKIVVDLDKVPYAQVHNEGSDHIPQRQYMPMGNEPPSQGLLKRVQKKVDYERDKIMAPFKK